MSPVVARLFSWAPRRPRAGRSTILLHRSASARPNPDQKEPPVPRRNSNASERPQSPPLPRIAPGTWPLSPSTRNAPTMTGRRT